VWLANGMSVPPLPDLDALSLDELKKLVVQLGLGQFPRQVGRVRQVDSGAFRTAGDMIRC
jgi:hypothetical protein